MRERGARKRFLLTVAVTAMTFGTLVSQTKTTIHSKPIPQHLPKVATLATAFQTATNMTAQEFTSAGLNKLDDDELTTLAALFSQRQSTAVEAAKRTTMQYRCGPFNGNYDKVKIYVDSSDGTPAQIMSGVRERLRSMPESKLFTHQPTLTLAFRF